MYMYISNTTDLNIMGHKGQELVDTLEDVPVVFQAKEEILDSDLSTGL